MSPPRPIILSTAILMLFATARADGSDNQSIKKVIDSVVALSSAGRLESAEARKLLTGEALARWKAPTLGPITGKASTVMIVRQGFAVARVTAGQADKGKDYYFYLTKAATWKVSAMRTLVVGLLYAAREQLREQKGPVPDREYSLKNLDLTLSTDEQLRAWFVSNGWELDAIMKTTDAAKRKELCHTLGIGEVRLEPAGAARFTIGGVLDNSVGFLYIPSGPPPEIDATEYIWVERIFPGWYLFRTT